MIRTEDEYRAACDRLAEQKVIMRIRAFTDDEQHEFDGLVADINAYHAKGKGASQPTAAHFEHRNPRTGTVRIMNRDQGAGAPEPGSAAASMANMTRVLASQGLTPPSVSAAAPSSMRRELLRAGLIPNEAA